MGANVPHPPSVALRTHELQPIDFFWQKNAKGCKCDMDSAMGDSAGGSMRGNNSSDANDTILRVWRWRRRRRSRRRRHRRRRWDMGEEQSLASQKGQVLLGGATHTAVGSARVYSQMPFCQSTRSRLRFRASEACLGHSHAPRPCADCRLPCCKWDGQTSRAARSMLYTL